MVAQRVRVVPMKLLVVMSVNCLMGCHCVCGHHWLK